VSTAAIGRLESAAEREDILALVRRFVDEEVRPAVPALEQADQYPAELLSQMASLGFYGILIAPEYGGLDLSYRTFSEIQMELSRGWMSLSGTLTSHFSCAAMIASFGTEEQKRALLPRMATGDLKFCFSVTEPDAGSDLQAIRTQAKAVDGGYRISGQKTWATHGLHANAIMLLAVTDPAARPRHKGTATFVLEKPSGVAQLPGLTIPPPLHKLGYKGVESTEIVFDDFFAPAEAVLGGPEAVGTGFKQFMSGLEGGRLSVASCATGIADEAFRQAIRYAQEREAFGRPIAQHQAVQLNLAQMATRVQAARLLCYDVADRLDDGRRADLEAAMAKLYASETAGAVALDAMRVLGGYGYSNEFPVERIYRDAPAFILGEGSNEIQQLVIARRLLERFSLR
jgi:alkylation response protein AidB-like acyl-CoA dehydrogenase